MMILRGLAAVVTATSAVMVAASWSPSVTRQALHLLPLDSGREA